MRKRAAVFWALIMAMSLAVPSFAEERPVSAEFSFNEYERIETLQSMSDNDLKELDITEADVDTMSEAFYEALMDRAMLSYEELKRMGYSDDSISILRRFAAGEELSPEELQAVSATCRGNIYCVGITKRGAYFYYEWRWDNAPIVKATDAAVVAWRAFGTDGEELKVSVTNTGNEIFYLVDNELVYIGNGDEIDTANFYAYAIKFPVTKNNGYAKEGRLFVEVEANDEISRDISYIKVSGLYGHTYVGLSTPSITVSDSLDITISGAVLTDKIADYKVKIGVDGSFERI